MPISKLARRRTRTAPHLSDDLSVVCFGGSAGGLDAYQTILSQLPDDTGLAFIIVNHQAADGKSLLLDILPHFTTMPVVLVEDGGIMRADHVYVVPPGKDVAMAGDALRLTARAALHGWPKNVTHFLSSLAADRQKQAIVVILSGFDSDGADALRAIKASGGIVFAQEFDTAKQPDMPISAVDTGCVDFLLSPGDIAKELRRIGEQRTHQKVHAAVTAS